jgi:hypothetical protein
MLVAKKRKLVIKQRKKTAKRKPAQKRKDVVQHQNHKFTAVMGSSGGNSGAFLLYISCKVYAVFYK